jgi:hypothetical protein
MTPTLASFRALPRVSEPLCSKNLASVEGIILIHREIEMEEGQRHVEQELNEPQDLGLFGYCPTDSGSPPKTVAIPGEDRLM